MILVPFMLWSYNYKPFWYTGARGTDHPPFSNFLFTNLFSISHRTDEFRELCLYLHFLAVWITFETFRLQIFRTKKRKSIDHRKSFVYAVNRVHEIRQSCEIWPAKFGQILLRTDTRLVFCSRKLMRTDIFFTRTPNPYAILWTLYRPGDEFRELCLYLHFLAVRITFETFRLQIFRTKKRKSIDHRKSFVYAVNEYKNLPYKIWGRFLFFHQWALLSMILVPFMLWSYNYKPFWYTGARGTDRVSP
jgi:hypothetical protein